MPVHWYYNRDALARDYGSVRDFLDPKNPHPDSIFWRSRWEAPSPELDILGDQRRFWGQRGTHYHQNLRAGDNTLTMQLGGLALESIDACGTYDRADYLVRYIDLLTHPTRHGDTYLEECHRGFFTNLGRGKKPEHCAVMEKHIGGISMMMPVAIRFGDDPEVATEHSLEHLSTTHAGKDCATAGRAILSLLLPTLNGASLAETIEEEISRQRNPHFGFPFRKWLQLEDERVIGSKLSPACYLDDAIPAVIYLALKYAKDPEQALIVNTNLGGDNVHRGSVLGALLGAAHGTDGWPNRWKSGLANPPHLPPVLASSDHG